MAFTSYNFRMSFTWTAHRFAGGALALDVANSVILRFDPARCVDRFEVPEQMASFAGAAQTFSAERALFGEIQSVRPDNNPTFIRMREAADGYFRALARDGLRTAYGEPGTANRLLCTGEPASANGDRSTGHLLADLLQALADLLRLAPQTPSLEAATAHSVLRLLALPDATRLKICPNCGWLFLDRSKNRSRAWCDMAVCGNRAKASRHYHRRQEDAP